MNYDKGRPFRTSETAGSRWLSWTDVASSGPLFGTFIANSTMPQPILSDIGFDIDGAMILGFMDRYGHQVGQRNYQHLTNLFITGLVSGDILRAAPDGNGMYITENAGISGGLTGYGDPFNYTEGPGGAEFYDDNFINGANGHGE
ncbi:MAG: hypothetical protein AAF597_06365, partial [Bacteroidota bacterium]